MWGEVWVDVRRGVRVWKSVEGRGGVGSLGKCGRCGEVQGKVRGMGRNVGR